MKLSIALLAAGCCLVAARDWVPSGSFHRTLKVTGPVELEVTTSAGHIQLRTGQSGRVSVIGTIRPQGSLTEDIEVGIRALEISPPIEQEGNRIRVGAWSRNLSISYELIVPAETRLRARSGAGEQSVDGIFGPVDVVSCSGKLTLLNIGGEVQARTGVGDIKLSSVDGDVQAITSSGSIDGTNIAGSIMARTGVGHVRLQQSAASDVEVITSSGSVDLSGAQGAVRIRTGVGNVSLRDSGDVEVETSSGSVRATGVHGALRVRTGVGHIAVEGEPAGEWHLGSGSGNVTVRLPSNAGFDLHARSSSGRIESGRPITIQGAIGGQELRGKVGHGGSLLRMRTGVGNIRIE